jgi:SAM-dependent methyltransferase
MPTANPPLPPVSMRSVVGPTAPEAFDNPSGAPIYDVFDLPPAAYDSVFDFGCGCGRLARQLLQQTPRPRRYVGLDVHREMIRWCRANLSPVDPAFQFVHHDVYSPSYAPDNRVQLAAPFPVEDKAFSLVLAHSVFTHLSRRQTDYYLHEVARILAPGGMAVTSWFFFDRDSFPFLREGPHCLVTDEDETGQAAIYDRRWFIQTVRDVGLGVWRTVPPSIAGHQWTVVLTPRQGAAADRFPLGSDGAEWLCGATARPMAVPTATANVIARNRIGEVGGGGRRHSEWPRPPALSGPLAELAVLRRSLAWKLWWLVKAAVRRLRR